MRDITHLTTYYSNYDEEGRLKGQKHGQVEYITTMKYIHRFLEEGMRVLEVGAGTGRYSLALAEEGFQVDAVELVEHNLNILKSHIWEGERITAQQGDALDLSRFDDETFDVTLVLGPMYHLYTVEEQVQALREAVRVTKRQGMIFVAYCMNEPTMIEYCFKAGQIKNCLEKNMVTEDFHCISKPEDLFRMERVEEIAHLNTFVPVERIVLVAADGATNYMRDVVDSMDEETFELFVKYHLTICERQDLIGASHHTLDILRRIG